MRHLFLLALFSVLLAASTILNSKIYDRDNRVDLLLSFDTIYAGTLNKYERDGKTYLILPGANIGQEEHFRFAHPFLKEINLYKSANRTLVEIDAPRSEITVSRVAPGYGLRIRTAPAPVKPLLEMTKTAPTTSRPQVGESVADLSEKYMIVGIFVASLLLLLLLIKIMAGRKLAGGGKGAPNEARILYSKPVDAKNRLLLIGFNDKHHLILMGAAGNVLIDTIAAESPADDFNALLKNNTKTLEKYLAAKEHDGVKAYRDKLNRK
jgi:hypothetical protein